MTAQAGGDRGACGADGYESVLGYDLVDGIARASFALPHWLPLSAFAPRALVLVAAVSFASSY